MYLCTYIHMYIIYIRACVYVCVCVCECVCACVFCTYPTPVCAKCNRQGDTGRGLGQAGAREGARAEAGAGSAEGT